MMVSEVFDILPRQWGIRGDPYLWDELKKELDYDIKNITAKQFRERLITLFEEKIGRTLNSDDMVYIEEYANGGMSSGHIDIVTWRERLIPFLIDNFVKAKAGTEDE
jgi:hypothetical protein